MEPTYLIYSKSTEDGRGHPDFIERTDDLEYAKKRCKEIAANPYDVGCVKVVTQFRIDYLGALQL